MNKKQYPTYIFTHKCVYLFSLKEDHRWVSVSGYKICSKDLEECENS